MFVFALILLIISSAALLASLISLRAIKQMGMFNRQYWRKEGIKNALLYLLWILLWVGSIGLLLEQDWGKLPVQIGLILLLLFIVFTSIGNIVGFVKAGTAQPIREVDDEGNEEIILPDKFWDEDLKAYIFKGIVINLVLTTLSSALIIWSLQFLQQH